MEKKKEGRKKSRRAYERERKKEGNQTFEWNKIDKFQRELVYAIWLLRKQWGFRDSEEEEKDTVVQWGFSELYNLLKSLIRNSVVSGQ